jgi:hypothetical protein
MPNLAPVAARLRQILERYVERLDVTQDGGGGMSLELRRRLQGKSCFNFTAIEEPLLRELETLTARSFDAFSSDAYARVPVSSRG